MNMMEVKVQYKDDTIRGLFADQKFSKSNIILILRGNKFPKPTRTSIQIRDKHIEHYEGGFMNHHCNPTAKILVIDDIEDGIVVAKRNIFKGEEITFDYETTEEIMAAPFECECHGRLISGWNAFQRVLTNKDPYDNDEFARSFEEE